MPIQLSEATGWGFPHSIKNGFETVQPSLLPTMATLATRRESRKSCLRRTTCGIRKPKRLVMGWTQDPDFGELQPVRRLARMGATILKAEETFKESMQEKKEPKLSRGKGRLHEAGQETHETQEFLGAFFGHWRREISAPPKLSTKVNDAGMFESFAETAQAFSSACWRFPGVVKRVTQPHVDLELSGPGGCRPSPVHPDRLGSGSYSVALSCWLL